MDHEERITGATRDLVEEVMRTAVALEDVLSILVADVPDEAFPGEDKGEALVEMVIGSVRPAVRVVGERDCRTAISLIGAIRARVFADLRIAAETPPRPQDRGGPDEEGRG